MAMSSSTVAALCPSPQWVRSVPLIEVAAGQVIGEVVVRLAGEAGFRQADELSTALLGLNALRPSLVILDLSGLHTVSCLTMGVLVTFRRGIVRAGGRVHLTRDLQEPVREALERAGLLALFNSPEAT
jgi:anti-anti-sigma factor